MIVLTTSFRTATSLFTTLTVQSTVLATHTAITARYVPLITAVSVVMTMQSHEFLCTYSQSSCTAFFQNYMCISTRPPYWYYNVRLLSFTVPSVALTVYFRNFAIIPPKTLHIQRV